MQTVGKDNIYLHISILGSTHRRIDRTFLFSSFCLDECVDDFFFFSFKTHTTLLYCIYYLTKEIKECAMSYSIDEYQNWRVTRGLGRGEEERWRIFTAKKNFEHKDWEVGDEDKITLYK